MIDSHCHLDHEPLLSDLTNVLKRSKDVGIKKLLTISTSFESFSRVKEIVKKDEIIYGTIGIHPHETNNNEINSDQIIKELKQNKKIIGIGETGLDFYYNNSDKKSQIELFSRHIEAANKTKAPLIIHTRSAEDETYKILKKSINNNIKFLIHCFTGSREFAYKLLDLGAYISASGIITFKKSGELADTFKKIPNDRILIETDAPYLSPEPLRGKTNEPSHIIYTLEFLSKIKGIDAKLLANYTSKNFLNLFGNLN